MSTDLSQVSSTQWGTEKGLGCGLNMIKIHCMNYQRIHDKIYHSVKMQTPYVSLVIAIPIANGWLWTSHPTPQFLSNILILGTVSPKQQKKNHYQKTQFAIQKTEEIILCAMGH